jgi:hypothetical protein
VLIQLVTAKQQLVNIAASNVVTHRLVKRIATAVIKTVTSRRVSNILTINEQSVRKI